METSWSDTSCATPIHIPNPFPMKICAATVDDDSVVTISWDPPQINNPELYFLEWSFDGQTWFQIATLPPTTFSFTDVNVNVDEESYYYRITVIDSCGDIAPWSNLGRTILLEAENEGTPQLFWNPYEQWDNGVSAYEIEVLNDLTGLFEPVDNVSGFTETYLDQLTNLDQPIYCYRVRGLEAGGTCRSLSNVACVPVGPTLYAPNAFTPNGDQINDFFELKGIYIATYNIKIFDRWGALIYESNSLEDHWDGTWRGKPCQEGVYVWVVNATGFDQTEINRRGTATLIR